MLAFLHVQRAFTKRVSAIRPVQVWYEPDVVFPGMVTIGPLPEQMSEAVVVLPLPPDVPPVDVPDAIAPALPPIARVPPVPPVPTESPGSFVPHPVANNAATAVEKIQSSRCFMMGRPFR